MNSKNIRWFCKHFDELDALTLHNILQLRNDVFIIEQDCHYRDLDGKDLQSHHVYGLNESNEVIAHARIIPKGVSYEYVSIGRVVVRKDYRLYGIGHDLMNYSMQKSKEIFGDEIIKIGAQSHLQKFYNAHDFVTVSDIFLEDNIEHVYMLYTPN